MTEEWTVKKLHDWTTDFFRKNSIENPRLEAEILLSHSLRIPRIQLYVQFERVLNGSELASFKKLVLRRKEREPVAYITGIQPFMSLDFEVNPSVLVPRPETEKLVEVAMDFLKGIDSPRIADIGTGSGAIAVSLAKYVPGAALTATDSSGEAVELARRNAARHGVDKRCEFFVGDLFGPLKGQFDLIVSNPPYVRTADIKSLQPEISRYEPRQALDGGEDGLKYYRLILEQAGKYLKPGGTLILEIGFGQAKDVEDISKASECFDNPRMRKDTAGIDRVFLTRRTSS